MKKVSLYGALICGAIMLCASGCEQSSASTTRSAPSPLSVEHTNNPGDASNGNDYPQRNLVAKAGAVQSTNNPGDASNGNSNPANSPWTPVHVQSTTGNPGDSSNGNTFH